MTTTTCLATRCCRMALAFLTAILAASPGEATPVTSIHTVLFDSFGTPVPGTITASFDVYTRPYGSLPGGSCCAPLGPPTLVAQLSLGAGSDFTVFIPRAIVDTHAPWEMPLPTGSGIFGGFPLAGLNLIGAGFPLPATVEALSDWCASPIAGNYVDTVFVMARRGACAFTDKVTTIQDHNGVGAVIVNHTPLLGAFDMALPGFTPSIPVIGLSYERGLQILQMLASTGTDTIPDLGYFDFAARWDPDPVDTGLTAMPEPASLLLLGAGVLRLAVARRRRA